MSTAQRVFLGYGVVILGVGFALGTVLGMMRMKAPAVRSLATAHTETLMQAALHFGLAFAVGAVGFRSTGATWGAWLLVVGSAMQATGAILNCITRTTDQFADRSPGFVVNSLSSFAMWPGLLITGYGILANL